MTPFFTWCDERKTKTFFLLLPFGTSQEVEVTRLIKGKPLDNMEFLQWLKIYHDEVTCGAGISDYNAEERRALSKGGNAFMKRKVQASKTTKGTKSYTRPGPASGTESSARTTARTTTTKQSAAEAKKLKELEEKNTSLKLSVDSLEQERDFYFAKLRDIEILCADRSLENNQVVKAVQTILFATEEYDIEGLIKQAGEKNAAADKVSVEKNITEEATVDLQPPSREPNGADQGTEKEAVTPKLEQTAKKQQTPTMDQVGKENVPSEAVVFSKSPLLPCEDCGVNFLEDTSGVDTLLKTSPFTLHNM